jgi:hypothetical protein
LGEKQHYFGGGTTLFFRLNAKINIAILGEDTGYLEEKQRYFGGETTLFYRQNAKNNVAILGEEHRYFGVETTLFCWGNNAIVWAECKKRTSLFWGRKLAIWREKQRYFEGETPLI